MELLAKKPRPIRRQHEKVSGSDRISGTEGRREPVPLVARSEGHFEFGCEIWRPWRAGKWAGFEISTLNGLYLRNRRS